MHIIAFEESMPDGADKTRYKNAKQIFSYLNFHSSTVKIHR